MIVTRKRGEGLQGRMAIMMGKSPIRMRCWATILDLLPTPGIRRIVRLLNLHSLIRSRFFNLKTACSTDVVRMGRE